MRNKKNVEMDFTKDVIKKIDKIYMIVSHLNSPQNKLKKFDNLSKYNLGKSQKLINKKTIEYILRFGLNQFIQDVENIAFEAAMKKANGKISLAADILKIGRKRMYELKNKANGTR